MEESHELGRRLLDVDRMDVEDAEEDGYQPKRSTNAELFIRTVPFFGLQLAWTVQQVYGVPYLLSIRVPETQLPLYVLSGPLAGFICPPLIAVVSDWFRSPSGSRKPLILLGGLGTIMFFLLFSSSIQTAGFLSDRIDLPMSASETTVSHFVAGCSLYALNFSIQPLMLGLRASIVDHFRPDEQATANLWIGRMSSVGSVFMALVGLMYSPEFSDLTLVVSWVLVLVMAVVAMSHSPERSEHGRRNHGETSGTSKSVRGHVKMIIARIRTLPPVTRRTCKVQLVSWFSWFLVLNYTSALISSMLNGTTALTKQNNARSINTANAGRSISIVALIFHVSALTTLVTVSLWQKRGNAAKGDAKPSFIDDGVSSHARSSYASMQRIWRCALAALLLSIILTCLLVGVAAPSDLAVSATSLCLGANGIFFALSNWVPYALIAQEASAQALMRAKFDDDGAAAKDDVPALLAAHNMAITAPQLMASVASWVLMQILAFAGVEQNVLWIFTMCIPAAMYAITL